MPSKIVVCFKSRSNDVFEGEYDAGVTPSNTLIISELVPDVSAKSANGVKATVKRIYNPSAWSQVKIS